jgi:hypothetical protein
MFQSACGTIEFPEHAQVGRRNPFQTAAFDEQCRSGSRSEPVDVSTSNPKMKPFG